MLSECVMDVFKECSPVSLQIMGRIFFRMKKHYGLIEFDKNNPVWKIIGCTVEDVAILNDYYCVHPIEFALGKLPE